MQSSVVFLCCIGSLSGCFFFSSRRRHTRCLSDWSSDVCSSDLEERLQTQQAVAGVNEPVESRLSDAGAGQIFPALLARQLGELRFEFGGEEHEIGRASCRERVSNSVVAEQVKKKDRQQVAARMR